MDLPTLKKWIAHHECAERLAAELALIALANHDDLGAESYRQQANGYQAQADKYRQMLEELQR